MKYGACILLSMCVVIGCSARIEKAADRDDWKYVIDDYRYIENSKGDKACLVLWTGIKSVWNMESIETHNFKYFRMTGRVEIVYDDGSNVVWNEGVIELNENGKVVVIK